MICFWIDDIKTTKTQLPVYIYLILGLMIFIVLCQIRFGEVLSIIWDYQVRHKMGKPYDILAYLCKLPWVNGPSKLLPSGGFLCGYCLSSIVFDRNLLF